MILTFIFTFLKKIKNRKSLYIFILYILIFYSFASKKNEVLQGVIELYTEKKLCIYRKKTVHMPKKNCAYAEKKLIDFGIKWYNKSMKKNSLAGISSCIFKITHKGAYYHDQYTKKCKKSEAGANLE